MIKKLLNLKVIVLCSVFLFAGFLNNTFAQESQIQAIKAGTFLKVLNLAEFSTLTADAEDELIFLNTQDMYLYETNILPANTKVFGEVEEVLEPVEGRDGAIKILIYKMITPDKKVYRVKGHIYSDNNNYLGGKSTSPVYYKRVPHYLNRMKPMLQAVPLSTLEMGKHTVVLPGAELFVIVEEDIVAK